MSMQQISWAAFAAVTFAAGFVGASATAADGAKRLSQLSRTQDASGGSAPVNHLTFDPQAFKSGANVASARLLDSAAKGDELLSTLARNSEPLSRVTADSPQQKMSGLANLKTAKSKAPKVNRRPPVELGALFSKDSGMGALARQGAALQSPIPKSIFDDRPSR